jgi:hypothetical protein
MIREEGTTVLPSVFAVFERCISFTCDARLFLDEGIAASCRGFAALHGTGRSAFYVARFVKSSVFSSHRPLPRPMAGVKGGVAGEANP